MSLENIDQPPVKRMGFFKARLIPLIAFLVSISILLGLSLGPNLDIEDAAMAQHYRLSLAQGQVLYGILTLVCFCAFVFANQFGRLFKHPIMVRITLLAVLVCSFVVVRLTAPDVDYHLGYYPARIWWIIFGIILLNGLAIVGIGLARNLPHFDRLTLLLLGVAVSALVVVYVISVGRYKNIEDFDEPWLANIATNYAQYGSLDSNYGGPQGDLFSPRYYLLMGLWLRTVGHSDLVALRAFPTLVALLTVGLIGIFLFRLPSLNNVQRLIGLTVMLGSMPFLWSSHNLRPEIGLAVYSALVLISAYHFFNGSRRSYWWLALLGVSLYIGLETIPTYAGTFAAAIGLIIVVHAFQRAAKRFEWREVAIYLLSVIGGAGLYVVTHFLPLNRLDGLSLYLQIYSYTNTGRFLTPKWLLNGLSLMNAISPIEILLVCGLLIGITWRGRGPDRWIAAIFWAAIITAFFPWSATVGYLALLAPFMAYAAARLSNSKITAALATFVLLPALISMPIYDVTNNVVKDQNLAFTNAAEVLTERIPEGSTIVGHDQLWYVLHTNRTFIGWPGVRVAAAINNSDFIQAVLWYKPDFVICQFDSQECNSINSSADFVQHSDVMIRDAHFIIYTRRPS